MVVAAGAGFGFGLWWGGRLSDAALVHRPRLLWVSLAVGMAFLLYAAIARASGEPRAGSRLRAVIDPRQWPADRLVSLAVLNLAIAAGIELGFNPSLL